jgi:spore coat-associated protein N
MITGGIMKKIFAMGFLMIALLASVGGGTWAWFQDTETSANNSLTAGTLDLNINGGNSGNATFSLTNLAPGDNGTAYGVLANVGSLPGELDMGISNLANVGGSGGTEYEGGSGELGYYARIAMYIDVDQNGAWDAGDIGLHYQGYTYSYPTSLQYAKVNWWADKSWEAVQVMAGGATDDLTIHWVLDGTVGNDIQGDSVTFDLDFVLEQPEVD